MRSWGVLWKSNNNDDEGDNYVDIIKRSESERLSKRHLAS